MGTAHHLQLPSASYVFVLQPPIPHGVAPVGELHYASCCDAKVHIWLELDKYEEEKSTLQFELIEHLPLEITAN